MHIFKDILPLGWIIAHFKCYICICGECVHMGVGEKNGQAKDVIIQQKP